MFWCTVTSVSGDLLQRALSLPIRYFKWASFFISLYIERNSNKVKNFFLSVPTAPAPQLCSLPQLVFWCTCTRSGCAGVLEGAIHLNVQIYLEFSAMLLWHLKISQDYFNFLWPKWSAQAPFLSWDCPFYYFLFQTAVNKRVSSSLWNWLCWKRWVNIFLSKLD